MLFTDYSQHPTLTCYRHQCSGRSDVRLLAARVHDGPIPDHRNIPWCLPNCHDSSQTASLDAGRARNPAIRSLLDQSGSSWNIGPRHSGSIINKHPDVSAHSSQITAVHPRSSQGDMCAHLIQSVMTQCNVSRAVIPSQSCIPEKVQPLVCSATDRPTQRLYQHMRSSINPMHNVSRTL